MSEFVTFKQKGLNMAAVRVNDIELVQEKISGSVGKYVEIQTKEFVFMADEPFAQVMKKIKDAQREGE
ncbi:hypothetical protein PPK16_gp78 [Bacillus phage 049ML001]|uniref:Uncharacterized protein n=1 Tax=Bacillus phage 049ML001 TaxID=2601660 RepID=A0A5P8PJY9_9CAUD|nr:hypothetical protein PPK16_gp78 [Bacillus phage 049ML001]QFR56380.1 hypothetical protein 049ML001_78 [Bacillus phage 049ML001]